MMDSAPSDGWIAELTVSRAKTLEQLLEINLKFFADHCNRKDEATNRRRNQDFLWEAKQVSLELNNVWSVWLWIVKHKNAIEC